MASLSSSSSSSTVLNVLYQDVTDATPPDSSVSPTTDTYISPARRWFKAGTGDDIGNWLCTYKNCTARIKKQSDSQTTNRLDHLREVHSMNIPKAPKTRQQQSKRLSSPSNAVNITSYLIPSISVNSASTRRPPTKQQRQQWTLMLLRMAVEMNVSFRSLCECEVFRVFLEAELGWNMPSRMTLQRLLPTYHTHLVSKLRDELQTVDSFCMDFTGDVLKAASPLKGKAAKQTELDRYLAHPQEDDRETEALQWWKLYGGKYPKVTALARRYLAIPASSAASERLFSQLKRTATAARQGLKPGTLCMLLFVEKHQEKLL